MKPYGMHWTLEQTESVRKDNGFSTIRPVDFWIVMNMAYNDYHNLFDENLDQYIKYSKLFILDEDAEDDKIYTYFTEIPKKIIKFLKCCILTDYLFLGSFFIYNKKFFNFF